MTLLTFCFIFSSELYVFFKFAYSWITVPIFLILIPTSWFFTLKKSNFGKNISNVSEIENKSINKQFVKQ